MNFEKQKFHIEGANNRGLVRYERPSGGALTSHFLFDGMSAAYTLPAISIHYNGTYNGAYLIANPGGGLRVGNKANQFAPCVASGFTQISDRTLKKEIVNIGSGNYEQYMQYIRGVETATYRYKTEDDETRPYPHIGVIAQSLPNELISKVSERPDENKQDKLAVSLGDMSGLMMVGIKANDERLSQQETDMESVNTEIDALKEQIRLLTVKLEQCSK